MVEVHLQNHSSVIITIGSTKILFDPWYMGSCFDGGWGLRFNNEDAFENVKACEYLWISHFHPDHYHVPTLKKILEIHPDIKFIGNSSYNFQLDNAAKSLGFKNVIPIYERKPLRLSNDIEITRFPVTGTDNMLLIQSPEVTILNYNDCVLPANARKVIAKKIGSIDIFLNNFNHAGKLLKQSLPTDQKMRQMLLSNYNHQFTPFAPRWAIPFASHHYYRAPESTEQNSSLITPDDLTVLSDSIISLKIGQSLVFDPATKQVLLKPVSDRVSLNPEEVLERNTIYDLDDLESAGREYAQKLSRGFPLLPRLLRPLNIFITDIGQAISFHPIKGVQSITASKEECDISAKSEALYRWFTKRYGADSFIVGAHFTIHTNRISHIKWYIICIMLFDNRLDLRSILKMLFTSKGMAFLLNRREEILGILTSGEITPEYQR